jgi:predicted transcriptional regulator
MKLLKKPMSLTVDPDLERQLVALAEKSNHAPVKVSDPRPRRHLR